MRVVRTISLQEIKGYREHKEMRWRYGELMKFLMAIAAGIFMKTFFDIGMQKFDCTKCTQMCRKELEDVDIIRPDLQQQLREQFKPKLLNEVLQYDFFNGKFMYGYNEDFPKVSLRGHERSDIKDIVQQAMSLFSITKHSEHPNKWELKSVLNGFRRFDPLRGEEFVLDISMQSRSEKPQIGVFRMELVKPYGPAQLVSLVPLRQRPVIHFLLPMHYSVNSSQLNRFLRDFENSCLKTRESVTVFVLLYIAPNPTAERRATEIKTRLMSVRIKYPGSRIRVIQTKKDPSRSFLLDLGVKQLGNDVLTSFISLDVSFSQTFLDRCRYNPVAGKRVYYPVMFSRYNPEIVSKYSPEEVAKDWDAISPHLGYWAHDQYDVICLYTQDYRNIEGFDLSIKHWGQESQGLYKKHIRRGYQIFRAIDPGLSRIYFNMQCNSSLPPADYNLCISDMARKYGSREQLAKKLLLNKT